jgi:hypothetical protein
VHEPHSERRRRRLERGLEQLKLGGTPDEPPAAGLAQSIGQHHGD